MALRPNLVIDLRGNYQPREYCVQYRESDFDFASRIMEDEGIYYYFQHAADKHVMVVTDVQAGLPELPQPTLILREEASAVNAGPCVSRWEKEQGVQSGACTLWDQCFEPDGRRLVGWLWKSGEIIVAPVSGEAEKRWRAHPNEIEGLAVSPDGRFLASVGDDGLAKIWTLDGREVARLSGHHGSVYAAAFSPDGKRLATTGMVDATVHVWDLPEDCWQGAAN